MYRENTRISFGDAMMECHSLALAEDANIRLITHNRVRFTISNALLRKPRGLLVTNGHISSSDHTARISDVKAIEVFRPREYEGPDLLLLQSSPGSVSDTLGHILRRLIQRNMHARVVHARDQQIQYDIRRDNLSEIRLLPGKVLFLPVQVGSATESIYYPVEGTHGFAFFGYHEAEVVRRVDL